MSNFSYYFHLFLLYFFRVVCNFIPKQKNLILFSSWFGKKYADSSKYLFEYMLENSDYELKWYTSDKKLFKELKENQIPVVYSKSILGIWTQVRAKMLVSSVQLADYNDYFLHNCILFDLDHGFALKQVGFAIPGFDKNNYNYQMAIRKGIDFWMSSPTFWSMGTVQECYCMSPDHIVRCNKPRTDVLFDESLRKGKNEIVDKIKAGRKAIVWMPTHRSCGDVKIQVKELIDLDALQKLCLDNNFVFIIKKHFYHKEEKEDLRNYPNVFDLTNEEIDSQVILNQADALVSDYSSSYIEYLVLDRPIILYVYDKDEYLKNERGLYIPLDKNTAGEIVTTKTDFMKSLTRIAHDWNDILFAEGRKEARQLYFDERIPLGEYRKHVKSIIDDLLQCKYTPQW